MDSLLLQQHHNQVGRRASTGSQSGLSCGSRGATYINETNNPEYNSVVCECFRISYGCDPVTDEDDKGDDVSQEVRSQMNLVILNRLARFLEYEGNEGKVVFCEHCFDPWLLLYIRKWYYPVI